MNDVARAETRRGKCVMRTACIALLVTAGAGRLARAEVAEEARRPAAVHAEVGFLLPLANGQAAQPNSTPGIASAGVGVAYDVRPALDVEVAVSTTGSSSRATKGGAAAPVDYGTIVRALVHWRRRASGFTPLLGAGPALIAGGTMGSVPLLHLEGGIEIRARSGFYLVAALQLVEPLITSRPDVDPAQCVTSDCPSRFNPSSPILGSRLGLGICF